MTICLCSRNANQCEYLNWNIWGSLSLVCVIYTRTHKHTHAHTLHTPWSFAVLTVLLSSFKVWHTWWLATKVWPPLTSLPVVFCYTPPHPSLLLTPTHTPCIPPLLHHHLVQEEVDSLGTELRSVFLGRVIEISWKLPHFFPSRTSVLIQTEIDDLGICSGAISYW